MQQQGTAESRDAHRETSPYPPRCFCHQQTVTKLLLERVPSTPASDSSQCFQAGVMLTKLSSTPSSEFGHENTSTPFCLMKKNSLSAPVLPRPGAGRAAASLAQLSIPPALLQPLHPACPAAAPAPTALSSICKCSISRRTCSPYSAGGTCWACPHVPRDGSLAAPAPSKLIPAVFLCL